MKTREIPAYAALLLAASALAAGAANGEGASVAPIPVPAGALNWTELDPAGAPGVKVAAVWGNPATGAFGAFFRLPAGFAAPLHTHTHDMKLVIVSGTYIQGPEGKPEFRLSSGSYLFQPGGDYRHTTSCDPATECLFFVESSGAFDLHAVAEKAAATEQLEPTLGPDRPDCRAARREHRDATTQHQPQEAS